MRKALGSSEQQNNNRIVTRTGQRGCENNRIATAMKVQQLDCANNSIVDSIRGRDSELPSAVTRIQGKSKLFSAVSRVEG